MHLKVLIVNVWSQFMPGLCELLPEDTDEPERLELLDAAIPASLHASVTPVRPTCAHSRSAAAVHPFPPLPCALYRPHQCRELFHASSEAPSRRLSESAGRSSVDAAQQLRLPHAVTGAASASG